MSKSETDEKRHGMLSHIAANAVENEVQNEPWRMNVAPITRTAVDSANAQNTIMTNHAIARFENDLVMTDAVHCSISGET